MFLKKIEMQGFKSFPDEIVIDFTEEVTGIVGPNGTGKSNITDAFRWVLGEQSAKSLRGSNMYDVIFAGSNNRKAVNTASVTLVFDNSQKLLNSDLDEIEVTRKIYKDSSEGEYYINKKPVRLKDINDLILDSGLGKDSLSIISQGTISSFAESKPSERRGLFEDAAGVAKYKKRKVEALGKLNRTQENIERLLDIVSELEKQVVPLKKASEKAKICQQKQDQLQAIEVSVLVHDISSAKEQLDEINKMLLESESELVSVDSAITLNETKQSQLRTSLVELDQNIQKAQENVMRLVDNISRLESQKTQLDEKSKYVLEVGNIQEKIQELSSLLQQTQLEIEDRQLRYDQANAQIELAEQQKLQYNHQLVEYNQLYQQKISQKESYQKSLIHQQQLIERPFFSNSGLTAILENKQSLQGIVDVVSKLLVPASGYELAIATALAGSGQYVVAKDETASKAAVQFLKKNRSGRATFIPLSIIKPRLISSEQEVLANSVDGYLGIASDFVSYQNQFDDLALNLLGNVLVAQDIESANQLARRLNYRLKIVTLEGDVFHVGGNISGGQQKENTSLLMAKKEVERLTALITKLDEELDEIQLKVNQINQSNQILSQQIMNSRLEVAKLEPILEVKKSKFDKLQADLQLLDPSYQQKEDYQNDLISQLNQAYQQKDHFMTQLSAWRTQHVDINHQLQQIHQTNSQLRREYQAITNRQNNHKIEVAKIETKLEADILRLGSTYQMTYEFAKDKAVPDLDIDSARNQVVDIRNDIIRLGAVNMNAPEEYEEINQRYEFLSKQLDDLNKSKTELLNFIDEMDDIMITQFKEMFDKINHEFDGVFKSLFGGGKAKLVLEDPEDLLNTGIDIDVSPPGKSIQNIRLFSGGEKSLIAISVLFAIMKARQMPMCIFDEVEAALDQANVERFAKYIRQFSKETQFLVVTHRPGTMAQCDVLYGVTMAAQGVSSILKVQLADATKMTEEGGN